MTRPSLQVPEIPPENAKEPPVVYVRWAQALAIWLIGAPIVYAIFLSPAPRSNPFAFWITICGFVVWAFSWFPFYALLLALKQYFPALAIVNGGLEFCLEILFAFL